MARKRIFYDDRKYTVFATTNTDIGGFALPTYEMRDYDIPEKRKKAGKQHKDYNKSLLGDYHDKHVSDSKNYSYPLL